MYIPMHYIYTYIVLYMDMRSKRFFTKMCKQGGRIKTVSHILA